MIPYLPPPILHLGGWRISPFNLMLLLAVTVWAILAIRHARHTGVDAGIMWRTCFWAVVATLTGAHIAKVTMEFWPRFLADPTLLFREPGIRSVGGVLGGLLGVLAYARFRNLRFSESLRLLDAITFALPFGWIFGRLGCFLVHDHRGPLTTSWLAVQFPEGPRFDLGLLELLFLIPFSGLFYLLNRKRRPLGFNFGLFGFGYGTFRIWLDTLALEPFRFYGWILVSLLGLAGWLWSVRFHARPPDRATAAQAHG